MCTNFYSIHLIMFCIMFAKDLLLKLVYKCNSIPVFYQKYTVVVNPNIWPDIRYPAFG
jgi:hypothetical protein